MAAKQDLVVYGIRIREDANGNVCLDDIHRLAERPKNREPSEWRRLPSTKTLIEALVRRAGKSRSDRNLTIETAAYYNRAARGTFAHPILATAYAGYLSPDLEIEIRAVYLRYRAGDATLADDILQRASPAANRWAATRALGRAARHDYTRTLDRHGVEGIGYALCTNAIYTQILDGKAQQLKDRRGVKPGENLRDAMTTAELAYVMAAEALATDRIEGEARWGNQDCEQATRKSARNIREAIERDKKDRFVPKMGISRSRD